MEKDIAISVKNVSKTFRIPHEKVTSVRGAVVNAFKSGGYEEFQALDDVSFEVKKGEFFGIIGRNGSGKSTLLKVLAGIYQADKGKVEIDGMISPFLELGIGFNPELSGRDNVYLNATVLGMTKKQIDEKFDSIVAFSELERFIDQKLKNYSSGMQVRLAFSVSIHANRDILLMDEVLAVGDTNFQSKCLTEFNKYRDAGRTVVIVTHDIAVVQRYCDRAMFLRSGKIIKIGKADEVGNAYVYENMSDEEKRMINEKEVTHIENDGDEYKSQKVVKITSIKLINKKGEEKNVFETGESMGICLKLDIYDETRKLNFGVGMHLVSGGQVFGYNTQADRFEIKRDCKEITLYFESMPVLKGDYYLNIACFGNMLESHYDFKPRCKIVKFYSDISKDSYRGVCDIKHEWKCN
ncbi:MAG: hypothetical protein UT50_C0001G0098 [Candidatus Moranbacteria bacterium GW2011_GWA2_39_41]|nr:MAG: hypothetical protein UT50_C0001G0098 [Candidatus Moranbacteria bacterium GW2011_GWA2_39_41]